MRNTVLQLYSESCILNVRDDCMKITSQGMSAALKWSFHEQGDHPHQFLKAGVIDTNLTYGGYAGAMVMIP